ncbi:MAG: TIR domain-containing protein [Anaerolineales bacterium]
MPFYRKLRVFLCHASQDNPVVDDLYNRLLAEGWVDPWLDKEKLLPGQDWDMEIERAVETTDAVIVCLSNNSVTKTGYVQKELRFVLDIADEKPEEEIFVIPIRLDECTVPRRLKKWQYVDYFPAKQEFQSFYRLLQALSARAESLGIPTSIGEPQAPNARVINSETPVSRRNNQEVKLVGERFQGTVTSAPIGKFFAFITRDEEDESIFVHFSDILDSNQRLVKGERVEFGTKDTPRGLTAIQVKRVFEEDSPIVSQEEATESLKELANMLNKASQREFTLLLLGKTGVGKSSIVNTLMGKQVAPIGDFRPTTFTVKYYRSEVQGIKFSIVDTPGLCDDLPEKSKDEIYLSEIKTNVKDIDCIWFTTPLSEPRVASDELMGISHITKVFGSKIWERSIIVLTKADLVHPMDYARTYKGRTDVLLEKISDYAGKDIAKRIPTVAVSNIFDHTPDGRLWLGELYTKVIIRISNFGALPFFLATANRLTSLETQVPQVVDEIQEPLLTRERFLTPKPIELNDKQQKEIKRHIAKLPEFDPTWTASLATAGFYAGLVTWNLPVFVVGGVGGAAVGAVVDGVRWLVEVFKRAKR